jgi:hypothetical protein
VAYETPEMSISCTARLVSSVPPQSDRLTVEMAQSPQNLSWDSISGDASTPQPALLTSINLFAIRIDRSAICREGVVF